MNGRHKADASSINMATLKTNKPAVDFVEPEVLFTMKPCSCSGLTLHNQQVSKHPVFFIAFPGCIGPKESRIKTSAAISQDEAS